MPCLKIEISFWNLWESQKLKYIRFSAEKITYIPNRNLEKKILVYISLSCHKRESLGKERKLEKFSLIYQWYLLEILLEDFFEILKYLIFLFLIFSRETCDSQQDSRPRKNTNISSKNLAKKFFLDDISLIPLWDVSLENLNETLGWEINMGYSYLQKF